MYVSELASILDCDNKPLWFSYVSLMHLTVLYNSNKWMWTIRQNFFFFNKKKAKSVVYIFIYLVYIYIIIEKEQADQQPVKNMNKHPSWGRFVSLHSKHIHLSWFRACKYSWLQWWKKINICTHFIKHMIIFILCFIVIYTILCLICAVPAIAKDLK